MDNQECDHVFKELVGYLNSAKLEWLVEAVQFQIDEGIEKTASIGSFEEIHSSQGGRPKLTRSRKTKATTIVDVDSKTKLHYLIDAIESVVVETAFMEEVIISELSSQADKGSLPVIMQFRSPADEHLAHEFGKQNLKDRLISAARLKEHLDKLRGEI